MYDIAYFTMRKNEKWKKERKIIDNALKKYKPADINSIIINEIHKPLNRLKSEYLPLTSLRWTILEFTSLFHFTQYMINM